MTSRDEKEGVGRYEYLGTLRWRAPRHAALVLRGNPAAIGCEDVPETARTLALQNALNPNPSISNRRARLFCSFLDERERDVNHGSILK